MRRRRWRVGGGAIVGLAVASLLVYPWWLSRRVDALAGDLCTDQVPPTSAYYEAVELDDRVRRFPGFGPSDVLYAAAARCTGNLAQACLGADYEPGRAATACPPWRDFATWFRAIGGDYAKICQVCAPHFGWPQ